MGSTYDPLNLNWLAALGVASPPKDSLEDLLGLASPPRPSTNALAALELAFGSLAPSVLSRTSLDSVVRALVPPSTNALNALVARPAPIAGTAPTKRKAFFSFHFDDIMRVNVVRNAWKITHPDNALMRSFYDSSLWERRKLEGDESIKRLIREGVCYTSAVCALVGSDTWLRRWVRYEIARAVIDGRGLLAVHLNGIRHHQTKTAHMRGTNPLEFMAVGKVQEDVWSLARYYLFEKIALRNFSGELQWAWMRYRDYSDPVTLPRWLADPAPGHVTPLSWYTQEYDYMVNEGHKNIGEWIDRAAKAAGR